jgi:hypothetical protein
MTKFDLAKAIAGKPVKTKDGRTLSELHLFSSGIKRPVVGLVEGDDILTEYTREGKYWLDGIESSYDLSMDVKVKTYWANLYNDDQGLELSGIYFSEEEATNSKTHPERYIKTISFEVEQ